VTRDQDATAFGGSSLEVPDDFVRGAPVGTVGRLVEL